MLRLWSIRLALLALAGVVLGPLLGFSGLVSPGVALGVYAAGAGVGLLAVLAGIITALRGGVRGGLSAVVLGLVALNAVFLPVLGRGGARNPPINDITTDVDDVPAFVHAGTLPDNQGRDLGYPEPFRRVVREHYASLRPLTLPEPPAAVFERAVALARAQPGWTLTHVDAAGGTFEGVATSSVFRFRDDLVVRVRPEAGGARVDMRSKSRLGRGDLGANAQRIQHFLDALARPSGGQAPPDALPRAGG